MRRVSVVLLHIAFLAMLTIFFMDFTFAYMEYFDIGINNVTRSMDVHLCLTPVVMASQIVTILLFDKFVSRRQPRWRILLNLMASIVTVSIVFLTFALSGGGVPREGGFIRFLGYFFFGLEPGRIPGSW